MDAVVPDIDPQRGKETLLVVDDEQMIVDINTMLFSQLGYTVVATTDALEALELFTTGLHQFDLVLTDQTMPKLTGEELAGQILKIDPHMPVILCTGNSAKISEAKCRQLGISKLVSKPVDTIYLSHLVRQLLDSREGGVE